MQRGFTLVELAIVLVILGLLVGGILVGQTLIRSAEIRNVSTEYDRYQSAVNAFRDKYLALPGDMPNATQVWGAADGSTGLTAGCATTASTDKLTCNGDNDRLIQAITPSNERFRFWQHLANAGLIEGSYDGTRSNTNSSSADDSNVPKSKLGEAYWFTANFGTSIDSGSVNRFAVVHGNGFYVGGLVADGWPYQPMMTPGELMILDEKMDDGRPARGKLIAFYATTCTDAGVATNLDANYLATNEELLCVPNFVRAF